MALTSLLLLVALASVSIAQTIDPTSTMMMMPPMTSVPAPMPTSTPASMPAVTAESVQRDHFFCLGENSTRRDFITTPDGDVTTNPNSPMYPLRWGLWIQYPVLSYLDTMRKRHLFFVISRMAAAANVPDLFARMCVAEVEQYGVSTFRESVFVKLYISGSVDPRTTLTNLNNAFLESYRRRVEMNPYTERFLDRTAINVNATNPDDMGQTLASRTVNDSVHPGCDRMSCPEGDPTLMAIVIGTYIGPAYYGPYSSEEYPEEVTVENLESDSLPTGGTFYPLSEFAVNPRPINYGLEAGDIVFAVFGSIFLTILAGAIILGFVIHPFFLA